MNKRLFHINILDHPTNRNKSVFFFTEKQHSDYFKEMLTRHQLSYEFEIDETEQKYYFGVDRRILGQVKKLNYLVFARFRKPFIPYRPLRYLILIVTLSCITLAIIGWLKS